MRGKQRVQEKQRGMRNSGVGRIITEK